MDVIEVVKALSDVSFGFIMLFLYLREREETKRLTNIIILSQGTVEKADLVQTQK